MKRDTYGLASRFQKKYPLTILALRKFSIIAFSTINSLYPTSNTREVNSLAVDFLGQVKGRVRLRREIERQKQQHEHRKGRMQLKSIIKDMSRKIDP